jgi:chemotaxis protein CheC
MMVINPAQEDALIEICNVGMSKAAKQLSILLNGHIEISIPKINLMDINTGYTDDLFPADKTLAYVFQIISEELEGRAIIVFQSEQSTLLTQAVIGKAPKLTEKEVRACEREAMLEIGNIIISACMSAIVNMLKCQIKLSVPQYSEDNIERLIKSQMNEVSESAKGVIVIATNLDASGHDISGKLLLMLTEQSIDRLFLGADQLLSG